MEYDFLFDETRNLLTIGYNMGTRGGNSSYYDLLASEARLCSFVAIAKGNCRRRAGLLWGGCSPARAENRSSCHGAVRCSST